MLATVLGLVVMIIMVCSWASRASGEGKGEKLPSTYVDSKGNTKPVYVPKMNPNRDYYFDGSRIRRRRYR